MQIIQRSLLMLFCSILTLTSIHGQRVNYTNTALTFIQNNFTKYNLKAEDVQNLKISSQTYDNKNDITRYYFSQTVNDIEIYSSIWPIIVKNENKVWGVTPSFIFDASSKANTATVSMDMFTALEKTVQFLDLDYSKPTIKGERPNGIIMLDGSTFSNSDILVKKVYFEKNNTLFLAWQFDIDAKNSSDYWNMIVDAQDGKVLAQNTYTSHCEFDHTGSYLGNADLHNHKKATKKQIVQERTTDIEETSTYYVLPRPAESPFHGDLETLTSPWDPTASPFGWHDVDGIEGAEYTITRGNNVHAYLDVTNNNAPSASDPEPDGGVDLNFVFPVNLLDEPSSYTDAATTNLFYMVNIMHDFTHAYGFDQESGNFQNTNYNEGSVWTDDDYVKAEAQDGSGTNNANFSTPPDGNNGRMQMYTWDRSASSQDLLTVNSPDEIVGTYATGSASFGMPVTEDNPIVGALALVDDGSSNPTLLCGNLQNGDEINGKIAVIDRGTCEFGSKSLKAQNAGAIGVIICNYANSIVGMAGGDDGGSVTIPVVSLSSVNCQSLKDFIENGVTITLQAPVSSDADDYDGDYDNGIIAHEFGHGISTRLVGGAGISNCLTNSNDAQGNTDGEQMGEGWSDFFTLVTCTQEGAQGADRRGIGTFVSREDVEGDGIRSFPYSTDMSINPVTYDYIMGLSVPHGVGSVWNSMIWDMYWAMVDEYGWDSDQIHGTGGNNKAIQLVMDGLKNTKCNPSFVDGRDGILAADEVLYGGVNKCLIWEVFARRGLGYSADAGSNWSRFDNTEAYDVPPGCIQELKVKKEVTGLVFPGDNIDVKLVLRNDTDVDAANVVVADEILDGLTPMPGSGSMPFNIEDGKVVFNIDNLTSGDTLLITYVMQTAQSPDYMSTYFFQDDMENEDVLFEAEFLNSGSIAWDIGDLYAHSGENSWTIFGSTESNDHAVTMVDELSITAENPILRFWHKYDTEPGADGGTVQVSTDGGTIWEFVEKEEFFRNGYRGLMQSNAFFAVGVWAFWAGDDQWQESYVDMSAYTGQDIKIRFRYASDANGESFGWSLDDVGLMDMFNYDGEVCITADGIDMSCVHAAGKGTIVDYSMDVAIDDPNLTNLSYSVMPNPNGGAFTVRINENGMSNGLIEVYTISGKVVYKEAIGQNTEIHLDLKGISKGVYFIKVKTETSIGVQKLILR